MEFRNVMEAVRVDVLIVGVEAAVRHRGKVEEEIEDELGYSYGTYRFFGNLG